MCFVTNLHLPNHPLCAICARTLYAPTPLRGARAEMSLCDMHQCLKSGGAEICLRDTLSAYDLQSHRYKVLADHKKVRGAMCNMLCAKRVAQRKKMSHLCNPRLHPVTSLHCNAIVFASTTIQSRATNVATPTQHHHPFSHFGEWSSHFHYNEEWRTV